MKRTACSTVQTEFCRYTELIRLCFQHKWIASLGAVSTVLCTPLHYLRREKREEKKKKKEVLHLSRCYTHTRFYTQKLLHTDAFTHKSFYTQTLSHTDPFTRKPFYTQKLLHTETFTHRSERAAPDVSKIFPILPQFLAIEHHFVRKGCDRTRAIAILPQILAIEHHFVRKGCDRTRAIAILPQFSAIEHFVRKGCDRTRAIAILPQFSAIELSCERVATGPVKSQFYLSFWWSNLISCETVALGQAQMKITSLPQFIAIEPHFVRKGCARTSADENRNFTTVFGDRTSFRAKGLRSNKCRWKSQFYHSFRRSNIISCERVATGPVKSQFYFSFWRSNLISCERVALGQVQMKITLLPQFIAIEPHSVRKGCARISADENRNFTSAFGDRMSFRAK